MRFVKSESSPLVKVLRNVVLIMFIVIFISIVYNFRNRESDTESALIAEATASRELKGVFIRDEQIKTYSGSGVLSYNVTDGGKLGNGSVIAEVYPDESQISINRKIDSLTRELDILKKIQNPGTLESAQPSNISAAIEENYRSFILCRDMQDYDTLEVVKDNLLVNMSTYQIITNEVSGFEQQITDINNELAQLRQQSSKPLETITSDKPAYFVSYCDGYENELTPENLSSLTAARIAEITDNRLTDSNIVGKLVNGYNWYIAGVVDNSRKEYNVGAEVKVRLDSSAEYFNASIYDIRDEGDPSKSVIILLCEQLSHDIVQHRTETVEIITGDYRGLKVPREAIRFVPMDEETTDPESGENVVTSVSYKGVYILKGEQVEFKKIDVVYEGSDYVLSEIHEDDLSYLALYDDIMIEGVEQSGK